MGGPEEEDAFWMRHALRLAARGYPTPNPHVGCVLVREGRVLGSGSHRLAGEPHAEAVALQKAGGEARGATAYVTLEPCSHFGRTPPCADALIRAGVTRVVAAIQDVNPVVSGAGFERLRNAGVVVEAGLFGQEAKALNEDYWTAAELGRPWVSLKLAQSLDGKIATVGGESKWITGDAARRLAHRLRAKHGAVLVGIGTILADDPLLTARFPGAPRQPLRIVLDPSARTPLMSRLAETARESAVAVFAGRNANPARISALETAGIRVVQLETGQQGRFKTEDVLAACWDLEVRSLLVEGGAGTYGAFLQSGCVDVVYAFLAPIFLGGQSALSAVGEIGVRMPAEAPRFAFRRIRRLGEDLLLEARPCRSLSEP